MRPVWLILIFHYYTRGLKQFLVNSKTFQKTDFFTDISNLKKKVKSFTAILTVKYIKKRAEH